MYTQIIDIFINVVYVTYYDLFEDIGRNTQEKLSADKIPHQDVYFRASIFLSQKKFCFLDLSFFRRVFWYRESQLCRRYSLSDVIKPFLHWTFQKI